MVIIGRVGAPFGVKGWVHVQSFTSPPSNLVKYDHWFLQVGQAWQRVEVECIRQQGNGFVAALESFDTRDKACEIRHSAIAVSREALPPLTPGEYYWTDLIDLTVLNVQNVELGKVTGLIETGSNDVLVVKKDLKEHLIPYVPGEFVLEVDLKSGYLRVDWDPEF